MFIHKSNEMVFHLPDKWASRQCALPEVQLPVSRL
jgi:hypothetical protein